MVAHGTPMHRGLPSACLQWSAVASPGSDIDREHTCQLPPCPLRLPAMIEVSDPNGSAPCALDGVSVVEWGNGRASAYAGRLLRGLGARVVLVEHGDEQRERAFPVGPGDTHDRQVQALVRFLHGGKLSVELDPRAPTGRESLLALCRSADILLLNRPFAELDAVGLSPEAIAGACPDLVVVVNTLAGLHPGARRLRSSDLVAHALGGIAYGTPGRVPDPAACPPLKPGGYQADYTAGLTAASAALLGLHLRRRTGRGQLFDVASQAIIASYMRMDIAFRTYGAGDSLNISGFSRQSPTGRASTLWGLVPCKDGYWAFQASEQYQWEGLMRAMGDPEWSKEARFQDPFDRMTYWDEIEPRFIEWSRDHTKSEIFHSAQANHVPVFPCYTIEDLLHDEQQAARGFFVDLPLDSDHDVVRVPGAAIHLEKTPLHHLEKPPAVGEHTREILGMLQNGAAV